MAGERHLTVYMIVDSRVLPCYVVTHEDEMPHNEAKKLVVHTWMCMRRRMGEHLAGFWGCLDSDYSPSKPAPKIASFAAVATSLFSQSSCGPSHEMYRDLSPNFMLYRGRL